MDILSRTINAARRYKRRNLLYQDFYVHGHHYAGSKNTTMQFYSLDIARHLAGKSFLDLGCNVGGLVFLAEQAGATRSVGVDQLSELIGKAKEIKSNHQMNSEFHVADIRNLPDLGSFDYVTCMAVFRHIFGQLMEEKRPGFVQPSRYLENDPMDVLIRQNLPDHDDVYRDYNDFIKGLMRLASQQFICSYRDQSGLMLRRHGEIDDYFRGLDSRVSNVEVYTVDRTLPYIAVSVFLR